MALIAPLIVLFSLGWASSHVSLESDLQHKVDPRLQPRLFGFLYGLYVLGAAIASLAVGRLIDSVGLSWGMIGFNAAVSLVGIAIWRLSRRLR